MANTLTGHGRRVVHVRTECQPKRGQMIQNLESIHHRSYQLAFALCRVQLVCPIQLF
jgi:hypothetical protein